jgi:hypothetical protein
MNTNTFQPDPHDTDDVEGHTLKSHVVPDEDVEGHSLKSHAVPDEDVDGHGARVNS